MNTQHDFNLIKGRFSVSEAELLLRELAQAKIQHHMRRLSWQDNAEEDIKFLEKRIREIESGLRDALQHIKISADGSGQVDIDGMVTIRTV
ncbi:MAG: hypothetical protein H7319_16185 [Spirosoma sp.]|nr:hypothetical protein [Spirosoma sp.]